MKLEFQAFGQNFELDLRQLADETVHSKLKWISQEERNLLTPILYLLREVELRKLFSSMGYKSLFEYAMKECGYSEDQAARRISAMRLLKELPELEEKISSGSLSLSSLTQAQTLFRSEKKHENAFSREQKLEVIKSLENKSRREAEKIVLSHSSKPEIFKPEKVRAVSENLNEIKAIVSDEILSKIEKLKGLLAHSHPHLSFAELLEKLCDLGLEEWDLGKKVVRNKKESTATAVTNLKIKNASPVTSASNLMIKNAPLLPAPARVTLQQKSKRAHIPNHVQREVWSKAKSQCENCGSSHALQIDHVKPVALNGTNAPENLRLLCRNCNQRAAIHHLGLQQMRFFTQ